MTHKITVGLQQKIGQPNYGSLGASCSIEVQVNDEDLGQQDVLAAKIRRAYAACRQSIAEELAKHHRHRTVEESNNGSSTAVPEPRPATDAQVRAIRAIASKAGVQLGVELNSRFGVRSPNQLSLGQASQMIDELKSQLQPTPS